MCRQWLNTLCVNFVYKSCAAHSMWFFFLLKKIWSCFRATLGSQQRGQEIKSTSLRVSLCPCLRTWGFSQAKSHLHWGRAFHIFDGLTLTHLYLSSKSIVHVGIQSLYVHPVLTNVWGLCLPLWSHMEESCGSWNLSVRHFPPPSCLTSSHSGLFFLHFQNVMELESCSM